MISKKAEPSSTVNVEEDNTATELRDRTIERLWSITEDLNVLYKENWTRLATREVLEFQKSLIHGLKSPIFPSPHDSISSRRYDSQNKKGHSQRWTFSSSLLYSLTLIATIGNYNQQFNQMYCSYLQYFWSTFHWRAILLQLKELLFASNFELHKKKINFLNRYSSYFQFC